MYLGVLLAGIFQFSIASFLESVKFFILTNSASQFGFFLSFDISKMTWFNFGSERRVEFYFGPILPRWKALRHFDIIFILCGSSFEPISTATSSSLIKSVVEGLFLVSWVSSFSSTVKSKYVYFYFLIFHLFAWTANLPLYLSALLYSMFILKVDFCSLVA